MGTVPGDPDQAEGHSSPQNRPPFSPLDFQHGNFHSEFCENVFFSLEKYLHILILPPDLQA